MSDQTANQPTCTRAEGSVELLIEPNAKDLGGFSVRRVLPSPKRRMVGPFIFFDHVGPAEFPPGEGIQVRPHPHIGLATVTYLFEGEIIHRDNLGYEQPIRAGAVNLMTAGRGIVHSERAGEDLNDSSRLHGIQSWMALPLEDEECAPEFTHYPADSLPEFEQQGVSVRVIMGSAFGRESPVKQYAPTLYLECRMPAGTSLDLPADYDELGAYLVSGELRVDDRSLDGGLMAVACSGAGLRLEAVKDSHVMVVGGARLGERHIWWNFVSSSTQRIEQAKDDWREGRFDGVPGDDEFIPLP
ncbi:MAG TPA: pirin family protein [Gammaproteobacteria bacterium]|nr:pirin family protein [Gammaproteobacteria bacterium]